MQIHSCFPLGEQIFLHGRRLVNYKDSDSRKRLLFAIVGSVIEREMNPVIVLDKVKFIANYKEVQEIQEMCDSEMDEDALASVKSLIVQFHLNTSQLLSITKSKNKQVFGSLTIDAILEHYIQCANIQDAQIIAHELDAKLFDYNKAEYWKIAGKIRTAIGLYKNEYQYHHRNNIFNDSIFINKEGEFSTSILLKYLTNFQTKCQILLSSFAELFTALRKQLLHKRTTEINELISELNNYQIDLELDSQDELKKIEIKRWNEHLSNFEIKITGGTNKKRHSLAKKAKNKQELINSMSELEVILKDALRVIDSEAQEFLKSVNVRSISNKRLEEIEKEVKQLVKSINDSRIFSNKIENNAISSLKQFENLKMIFSELLTAQNQIMTMGGYYDWKAFLATQNKQVKNVINALHTFPSSEWENIFESYYFHKLIEKSVGYKQASVDEALLNYSASCIEIDDFHSSLLKNKLANSNMPGSKKVEVIGKGSFNDLVTDNFYIFIDEAFSKVEHDSFTSNYCVLQATNETRENISYMHHSYVGQKLRDADINIKLDQARFLSKNIVFDTDNLHLFLSKNSNIILHCSSWKKDKFLETFPSKGMKNIRINDKLEQAITEFFLNDSEYSYYIYDNFYFEVEDASSLYKRIQFLLALQNAGYKTIFVNTQRLLENPDYLDELVHDLEINY